MLKQLEERAKELAQKLEESAANHNSLIGAMNEIKALYQAAQAEAAPAEALVGEVLPADGQV